MCDNNSHHDPSIQDIIQDQQESVAQNSSNEWKEKYMRLLADFQNFQKRLDKDYGALKKSVQAGFLLDIFTIFDNIQRALQATSIIAHESGLKIGIELVAKDIVKILDKYHVRRIDALQIFDPVYHEAIAYVDAEGKESGSIVTVFEDGYIVDDIVLRPAKVTVAR